MAFETNTAGILITDIADEDYEIIDSVPQESENGWDSLQLTLLHRSSTAANDPEALLSDPLYAAAGDYERGANPFGDMYVVKRTPKVVGPSIFQVEVDLRGILSDRGFKVTYDNASQQQSGQNILAPDPLGSPTTYARVQVRESQVTAVLEYPLFDVEPDGFGFPTEFTATSDLALPFGWEPTVPASIWASLTDFTYHYPNGWIFDGASIENLAGLNNVFWVREKYIYQQPYTP